MNFSPSISYTDISLVAGCCYIDRVPSIRFLYRYIPALRTYISLVSDNFSDPSERHTRDPEASPIRLQRSFRMLDAWLTLEVGGRHRRYVFYFRNELLHGTFLCAIPGAWKQPSTQTNRMSAADSVLEYQLFIAEYVVDRLRIAVQEAPR